MHRRILASAAAAALAFGLAACGDDGENGTVTTPPPSVSVGGNGGGDAPSDGGDSTDGDGNEASDGGGDATAAAPDIPAPDPADYPGMDQNTPEGAEQAFRYYVAVMIWGYQTGDSGPLSELHDSECQTCTLNAETIEDLNAENKFWSSADVEDIGTSTFDSENFDIEVGYTFYLSAHDEPTPGSDEVTQKPRTKFISAAAMSFDDGQWVVESARFTPDEAPND